MTLFPAIGRQGDRSGICNSAKGSGDGGSAVRGLFPGAGLAGHRRIAQEFSVSAEDECDDLHLCIGTPDERANDWNISLRPCGSVHVAVAGGLKAIGGLRDGGRFAEKGSHVGPCAFPGLHLRQLPLVDLVAMRGAPLQNKEAERKCNDFFHGNFIQKIEHGNGYALSSPFATFLTFSGVERERDALRGCPTIRVCQPLCVCHHALGRVAL